MNFLSTIEKISPNTENSLKKTYSNTIFFKNEKFCLSPIIFNHASVEN